MKTKKEKRLGQEQKYTRISSLLWALKKLWRVDKCYIGFIFASAPTAVIQPLLYSYLAKVLIDRIGAGVSFGTLCLIVFSFTVIRILLSLIDRYIQEKSTGTLFYATHACQIEMGQYEGYDTDYENTQRQDFKRISGYAWRDSEGECALEFVWKDMEKTLANGLGILVYASLLVILNPAVLLVVGLTSAMSYFTTRWQSVYFEKNKQNWEKEERKKSYLQKLSDDFPAAKDIKLYGMEGWLDKMMQDYQAYILMWSRRCSLRGMWASMLAGLMTFVQDSVAYLVLIGLLLDGGITVGEFVFYFGLVGSIAGFLQGIIGDMAKLNTRADQIAYYRRFYDYPSRWNHGDGCDLPTAPVKIELRDVWYRYDGAEEYTLRGINLVVEAGESLALVGVNGAGKTTLIKLICGMYAPTRGEILVGGRRIGEYNIEEYYSLISAVFQEIQAVAFTLFEFVASSDLERPTARRDAIAAMKAAGIYDRAAGLVNGIDTHLMKGVYDDGVDLSGGEMQKLVLARAIYKDGAILVLDEPTAALDPIAENQLYLQYRKLTQGKTSIYISHRFASTRFCDRIILLQDGVITEMGTHEELMQAGGQYACMFGVQSKYYREGEIHA